MFLRIGSVLAWLAFLLGGARAGIGYFIAFTSDAETRAAMAARYLGSSTTGNAIDKGLMVMAFGVTLGVLVSIGHSLRKMAAKPKAGA